jgi:hypothetical protein
LQTLELQRASLDPMADAVALQRSLQAHGDAARPVLQGRLQLEPERQRRQADVDRRLDDLGHALAAGLWAKAIEEAHALASDWAQLARQVANRSIGAAQSDHAHRLRVEQALQVMDLLSLALGPELPGVPGASARAAAPCCPVSRNSSRSPRRPATRPSCAPWSPANSRCCTACVACWRCTPTTRWPRRPPTLSNRSGSLQSALAHPDADWTGARDLAVQAQLDLLVLARNHAAQSLDDRLQAVQQSPRRLGRCPHRPGRAGPDAAADTWCAPPRMAGARDAAAAGTEASPRAESQPEAGRLIQRLRRGRGVDNAAQASDPQASLPPER